MSITLTGQASAPAAPSAGKYKFYIDDSGQAYVVDSGGNAVPVAPSGVDGAGGTDGQVWTADGAGGAAWENAPGLPGSPTRLIFEISQSGTNAPTVTDIYNPDMVTVTPAYMGTGQYLLTFSQPIFSNDPVDTGVFSVIGPGSNSTGPNCYVYRAVPLTSTQMAVVSYSNNTFSNSLLVRAVLHIDVY